MGIECGQGEYLTPAGTSNDLSGTVLGPSVQAAAIHGGIHFHGGPDDRHLIPRQLPATSAHFTDRTREISELDRLLSQGGNAIAVLYGPGGVGKSALARQWAHGAKNKFADGQLYADLRGFSGDNPVDPGEVLSAFLRALGVTPQRIPVSLPEQAALYRTVTANRSILLMLDDALSAAQVRPLVPASTSAVLVTSRRRLTGLIPDGARLLEVGALPAPEAVELLTRAVGQRRISQEVELAEELAEICAGLPIALTVAAGRLAARPFLSVRRVVSELADEAERLTRLSAMDGLSIRTVFDVSYRALTSGASSLYRRLSLHPGPDFGVGLVTALAEVGHGGRTRVDEVVGELLEASLLEEVAENRFRFHDLLRLHAREMAELHDADAVRRAVVHGMLEFYLAAAHRADLVVTPYRQRLPYADHQAFGAPPEFFGRGDALAWLERERTNLMHAGRAAFELGYYELAWQLSDVMWPLLLYVKNYRDRLEIDERGVRAARAWENVWAEANMLKRLSRVCGRVGDYEAAERHGRTAVDRYREAGDTPGTLDAEEGLATLYLETGREDQAADAFTRILAGRRKLSDARSIGLTCINLGMLLTRTGRPTDALPLLLEARQIFAGLSEVDPYNGARVLIGLAGAYLGIGNLDVAEETATEAARRMAELGSDNERAEALDLLGRIAQERGDDATARQHYRQALAVFHTLGSPRFRDVARRLDELGGTAGQA